MAGRSANCESHDCPESGGHNQSPRDAIPRTDPFQTRSPNLKEGKHAPGYHKEIAASRFQLTGSTLADKGGSSGSIGAVGLLMDCP